MVGMLTFIYSILIDHRKLRFPGQPWSCLINAVCLGGILKMKMFSLGPTQKFCALFSTSTISTVGLYPYGFLSGGGERKQGGNSLILGLS